MPKRIALFILGVVLFIGAFLAYQYFSGASYTTRLKVSTVSTAPPTTMPLGFESRNEKGELEYLITSEKAEQIRDQNGRPLPGQFLFRKPVATFFDRTGRTVEIRGDTFRAVVDQSIRANRSGTGALFSGDTSTTRSSKDTVNMLAAVRLGQLSGHVRLTIGAQPDQPVATPIVGDLPATAPAPAPTDAGKSFRGEMRIYFDDTVEFDGNQQILSSPGKIYVRSDVVAFDAEGLALAFNRDAQRIEYLRIDKGNRILLRNVGSRALALAETGDDAPATRPANAKKPAPAANRTATAPVAVASTRPARKPPVPPTVYKLSFGESVRAAVGRSSMTSERLYLLFMGARDLAAGDNKDNAPDAAPAGGAVAGGPLAPANPAPPATRVADDTPGPMPAEGENDLVVTWSGPMEMRPAGDQDLKLASSRDIALDAVGTADRPVEVHDPRAITKSGELWYHSEEHRIKLEPGAYGRVDIESQESRTQVAGNNALEGLGGGKLSAREVTFFQAENRAELLGPGTLEMRSKRTAEVTTLAWKQRMDADFVKLADAANPGKSVMGLRHVKISGAGFHNDTIDLTSEQLDVLVANSKDSRGQLAPALEHLLATGRVSVDVLKRNNLVLRPGAPLDGIRSDNLEILTAPLAGKAPTPSQMIATGNVSSWRYNLPGRKNREDVKDDINDPMKLEKQLVSASRLVVDLKARENSRANGAAVADGQGFEGFGQIDPTHLVATDNVRVEITPPAAGAESGPRRPPIVAIADKLDADPVAGTAQLTVSDAKPTEVVRITMGEDNSIQGRRVDLVSQQGPGGKQEIHIPGPGQFAFTLPPDKSRKTPVPVFVSWMESMAYDNISKLATIKGAPVAKMAGDKEGLGELKVQQLLRVHLKENGPATRPADAADPFASGSIVLDYMEAGSPSINGKPTDYVDARGQQLATDGTKLTDMVLSTSHLVYREDSHQFEVREPGKLAINNYRPDKPDDKMSRQGLAGFQWAGSLVFDNQNNSITMQKDVIFIFQPVKPLHLALDAQPGAGEKMYDAKWVKLQTEQLVATLSKPAGAAASSESPIGFGSGGNQDLEKVVASNGAILNVGDIGLSGQKLEFNKNANTVAVEGGTGRVTLTQPMVPVATFDSIFWDMTKDHNAFVSKGGQANFQIQLPGK